ncbi:MAG: hypothetical protein Q7J60_07055 [Bradyrhizobium sp.]|nr:hypothetical protein [Bradyrhizobium sp.]
MSGVAFDWLKAGHGRPESAKQVEIGLAGLAKILSIQPSGQPERSGTGIWCRNPLM